MTLPELPIPIWLIVMLWFLAIVSLKTARVLHDSGHRDAPLVRATMNVEFGLVLIVYSSVMAGTYLAVRAMAPSLEFLKIGLAMIAAPIGGMALSAGVGKTTEFFLKKFVPPLPRDE